jgi:hypothetical protein
MGAVVIHPMAVDNSWQCRPQESPANKQQRAVRSMRSVLYSVYQVHSPPFRDLLTNKGSSKPP